MPSYLDTFREDVRELVWGLLEALKVDPSPQNQQRIRDELTTMICDPLSSWETNPVQESSDNDSDDFSFRKEKWIAP